MEKELQGVFPKDSEDASAMIAADLNRLSLEERERVFFDIHGIAVAEEESSEMLTRCLSELDARISAIRDKQAYNLALSQNPSYVTDQTFRLHFLRSAKFDTSSAAKKMIGFFKIKMDLFGVDKLTKDITLDDLDESTLSCLESGVCTVLPLKDRAGRVVFCWTVKLSGTSSIESRVSRLYCGEIVLCLNTQNPQADNNPIVFSQFRVLFYTCMTFLGDDGAAKRGVVGIDLLDGDPDIRAAWKFPSIVRVLPIRLEAIHLCHEGVVANIKLVDSVMKLVAGMFLRVRCRSHYGE